MYAGTSFIAMTERTPRTASQMVMLTSDRPLCLRMNLSPVLPLVDSVADSLEIAEVHPYQEGAALDVIVGHESPVAAVAALVSVVAHHEVLAGRDRAAEAVVIVVAILPVGELPHLRQLHRRLPRDHHELVRVGAHLLGVRGK